MRSLLLGLMLMAAATRAQAGTFLVCYAQGPNDPTHLQLAVEAPIGQVLPSAAATLLDTVQDSSNVAFCSKPGATGAFTITLPEGSVYRVWLRAVDASGTPSPYGPTLDGLGYIDVAVPLSTASTTSTTLASTSTTSLSTTSSSSTSTSRTTSSSTSTSRTTSSSSSSSRTTTTVGTTSSTAVPAPTFLEVTPAGLTELSKLGVILASVPNALGGGNHDLNVIRDGDFPPLGSADSFRQYDSYHGDGVAAATAWIGYDFVTVQHRFRRVLFEEGKHFTDGGAFATFAVQVRQSGVWVTVPQATILPTYVGITGPNFQTYTLDFTPIAGDAIRLYGDPDGRNDFISVAELQVFE